MKSYDLVASTEAMTEFDGPGGEFVLAVEFEERAEIIQKQKLEIAKLRDELASTYTDDVIAVMRDTIEAQRKAIEAQRELITELENEFAALRREMGAILDGGFHP